MKKIIYIIGVFVLCLTTLTMYTTYAMFTTSVSSDTALNLDTTLNYNFGISGVKRFTLEAETVISFNMIIKNSISNSMKYGIYYNYVSGDEGIVGEVVSDASSVTVSSNSTGVLSANASKTVNMAIYNNTLSTVVVEVGVVSDEVTLVYPDGAVLVSDTIDDDMLDDGVCTSKLSYDEDDCYSVRENGYVNTYCNILTNSTVVNNLDESGASIPNLIDGMIPVYYNGTNWVKANYLNDTTINQWYDYNEKEWANAVMVSSTTRDSYLSDATTPVGTVIPESDILAYYVWIPRYKYKLFNVSSSTSTSPSLIDVVFEDKNASDYVKATGSENETYLTHPAFTFGDDELDGIWVAKFETTGTSTLPTSKSGLSPLTNQSMSAQFSTAKLLGTETYLTATGVSKSDAHMMKNTEWGAVAYLKQSAYGLGNTNIGNNAYVSSNSYMTGCGPVSASDLTSTTTTCNSYTTTVGMLASTTGNVYGVYDMAGGVWENVMGVLKTSAGTALTYSSSGFTTSSLPYGSKYVDMYTYGTSNSTYTNRLLGDATGETLNWYSDQKEFVYSSGPWFLRGGRSDNTTSAGIYAFASRTGEAVSTYGFRSVLVNIN